MHVLYDYYKGPISQSSSSKGGFNLGSAICLAHNEYYSCGSFNEVSMNAYDPVLVCIRYMAYFAIMRYQCLAKAFKQVKAVFHAMTGLCRERCEKDNDICRFLVLYE